MSRIQIKIIENWKGQLPSQVEIRSFGGFLDGFPYFAEAFPQFHEGEDVILFLKNFPDGIFPLGHSLGKKTVTNEFFVAVPAQEIVIYPDMGSNNGVLCHPCPSPVDQVTLQIR